MESDSVPMVKPTISKAEAAAERWDVIVVGAGIAGSLASLGLARLGRKNDAREVFRTVQATAPGSDVDRALRSLDRGNGD